MGRVNDEEISYQKPSDDDRDTKNEMEIDDCFRQMDHEYVLLNGWSKP